ncbi:MAG: SDR family oxidoreductase, partial [Verrucomicrobiota bacterium]
DILVNNAAIQPHGISLQDTTPELLDQVFKVNSHAVFYGIQLAFEFLVEGGRVINTSSFVGKLGVPNCSSYAASKASVDHLTRVGAMELASRRITVNAVSPGLVLTPAVTEIPENPEIPFVMKRTPLGRVPRAEEIAPLYEFLASEKAGFITGAVIPIDGGLAAGWNAYELKPPAWWS